MPATRDEVWEELNAAIADLFEEGNWISKDVKVFFGRPKEVGGKDAITIGSGEIDNCFNDEYEWRWDIVLRPDGTWTIE